MSNPYRRIDHPSTYFANTAQDAKPLKAHGAAEVLRRQDRGPGLLVPELDYLGILMLNSWLGPLEGDDLIEAVNLAGPAMLGADYYNRVRGSTRMRKDISIPDLVDRETDLRLDPATARRNALGGLASSAQLARDKFEATAARSPRRYVLAHQLGRSLSDTSMMLVTLPLTEMAHISAFDAQEVGRNEGMALFEHTRKLAQETGTLPSVIQLVQPTSPLAVHIANNTDGAVYDAFQNALDRHAIAA